MPSDENLNYIEKNLEDIKQIHDIIGAVMSCPLYTTDRVVDIKECDQVIHIPGKWANGPAGYIQIIRIAKTIIELLQNCKDKKAKQLLKKYDKKGILSSCSPFATDIVTIWCDHISNPDTVITVEIGNLIIPFSFSDYIFEKSDKAEQFYQLLKEYNIPADFGRIAQSVDDIKDRVELSEKAFALDNTKTIEDKINGCIMMLEPTEENKDFIFLFGLKERYRQSLCSFNFTLNKINELIDATPEYIRKNTKKGTQHHD